jgi:hypothetical protein
MPFINVYVKFKENKIFDWLAVPIDEKMNIQQFFDNFSAIYLDQKYLNCEVTAHFGSTKSSLFSNYNEVSLECNALEIINIFGINCIFKLNEERLTGEVLINSINPFDEMMKNSSSICYPTFKIPANNALQQLEIDLVELLKKNKAGWLGTESANNIGVKFIRDLAAALWYIDKCSVNTFKARYIIPIIFDDYFGRANPEKHKQARKPFNVDDLQLHSTTLSNYLELKWFSKANFIWLKEPLNILIENMSNYANYLVIQQASSKKNQRQLFPVVNEELNGSISIYQPNTWRQPKTVATYYTLMLEIEKAELWEPVNINPFCPIERM